MVPKGYWNRKNINKYWSNKISSEDYSDRYSEEGEVFLSELLKDWIYKKANLKDVVNTSKNLTTEQQEKLYSLLQKHEGLFQGKRGHWTGDEVSIELKENVMPFYGKAYGVPL